MSLDIFSASRAASWLLAALSLIATTGCQAPAAACETVGLCDEPLKPPVCVDIICDRSQGSSCSPKNLEATLGTVLEHIADRGGSHVRLFSLGSTVEKTAMLVDHALPTAKPGSAKNRKAQVARAAAAAREVVLSAAAPSFDNPPARRSPIAESIAKVALSDALLLPRRMIVITDGREVSAMDFECNALPNDAQFGMFLKRLNVLQSGQLAGIDIQFAYVAVQPGHGRCPVTVDRELRIKGLWTAALKAGGAAHVRISSGPPVFEEQTIDRFNGGEK
jgi:hypothetical protein